MKEEAYGVTSGFGGPWLGIRSSTGRTPLVSLLIIAAVAVCSLLAPWIAPYDPIKHDLRNALLPPLSHERGGEKNLHILGTDNVGRDVLSRLIHGAGVSMLVALSAIGGAAAVGTTLGLVSGFFGGWTDRILMRITDAMLAMPYILIAIVIVVVLGSSLQNIVGVIVFMTWAGYARMVRGEVLTIKQRDFVELARIAGCGRTRIIVKHILPNVFNTLIVLTTLSVGTVILFEAALSFLGMGIQPPTPAWGRMVSEGRSYITVAWWLCVFPGIAIMLTVLAVNLFGDWLRDRLDPRLRQI